MDNLVAQSRKMYRIFNENLLYYVCKSLWREILCKSMDITQCSGLMTLNLSIQTRRLQLTQQSGGGVPSSDGGRPVMADSGQLGTDNSMSTNVAKGVHVALPCRHR